MIKSLVMMNKPNNYKNEKWLMYLYNTKRKNYNINNVKSLKEINKHSVFNYVKKSLLVLNKINEENKLDSDTLYYVEETLKYMDTSKCGNKEDIKRWKSKNYDLFCHNIGSASIYKEENNNEIVYTLIKTHGLIGQYIKGEVILSKNKPLYELINKGLITKEELRRVLIILNRCIIEPISNKLYENIKDDTIIIIDRIVNGDLEETVSVKERFIKLNNGISDEEEVLLDNLSEEIINRLNIIFNNLELWYYDTALKEFSLEEKIKILLFVKYNDSYNHLTFENFARSMYLEYNNKKEINIYKKRIIEKYLSDISYEDIINNKIENNAHINYDIKIYNDTISFDFKFSIQAKRLISYCEVAYISDNLYQKSVYLLYDLFGFRKDDYDRFYNEINYLNRMNSSLKQKSIILDYIVGDKILDIGPGGGALLDLMEKEYPYASINGIDISSNVIESLTKKKLKENHKWNIIKGDALDLDRYINNVDSIIFSSIIHELYSLVTFEGRKFNYNIIKCALVNAYNVLNSKGRIIIRDGIMSENKNDNRIIKFKNKNDINILKRYCNDFKGRSITFTYVNDDSVLMNVNDAMEFLYTYTWGEESYPNEVKEQFGYFTVSEYVKFIKDNLPNCKVIEAKSFLQDGYEEHLLDKISIYDENMNEVKLPDSTSIIVIEKE